MAKSSVSSLRHEFPALALAITFIPRRSRLVYVDLFLLLCKIDCLFWLTTRSEH